MVKEEQKELEKLTRTKLVEEAKKYPDIVGASGMKKEDLLAAIHAEREKLGEEAAEDTKKSGSASKPEKKKGAGREELKATLAALKRSRQEALESGDSVQLKRIRRRYKKVNRSLQRSAKAQT